MKRKFRKIVFSMLIILLIMNIFGNFAFASRCSSSKFNK